VSEVAVDGRSRASGARPAARKKGASLSVYNPVGQKIGSAEKVFVSWDGETMYVRVWVGLFGMKLVLIPVQLVETDEGRKAFIIK
jgi:hypothetical protein